ncbi:hypothetical protein PISMIDRAFT_671361 [Pisolithus microcarpus 441]|uniref:Uncharacterized protein n=1 Tax=Pisolithus microcarpus 441 TaxID=765257 RepID=A0A0D0ADR2_9AGAM|nr:hypothetical protein PISMIDRAFT_671361 [Pisolithus microcarpus 441]
MAATRVQNNFSNRAKARLALERKFAFKSVLENPFRVKWPSVPVNLQNLCLARLVTCLESLPPRQRSGKVRKDAVAMPAQNTPKPSGGAECHLEQSTVHQSNTFPTADLACPSLVIGINQITRALEHQIRSARWLTTVHDPGQPANSREPCAELSVVFACSSDVNPPILLEHIPHLVASCNSLSTAKRGSTTKVKLVPLPKGSEPILARAVSLRTAAVIGVYKNHPIFASVQDILDSVPDLVAPWLSSPETSQQQFIPTHIKQLRTSIPKDIKAAKEQRLRARKEAKSKTQPSQLPLRKSRLILTANEK